MVNNLQVMWADQLFAKVLPQTRLPFRNDYQHSGILGPQCFENH